MYNDNHNNHNENNINVINAFNVGVKKTDPWQICIVQHKSYKELN